MVFRVKKKEDIISQVVVQSDTSVKRLRIINVPVVAEDKRF